MNNGGIQEQRDQLGSTSKVQCFQLSTNECYLLCSVIYQLAVLKIERCEKNGSVKCREMGQVERGREVGEGEEEACWEGRGGGNSRICH